MSNLLKIVNMEKKYEDTKVLNDINFSMDGNETLAIIGPSGGGKTTLLRSIVGLDGDYSGKISLEGLELKKGSINGEIGIVFQDFNLFPHMSVGENILLAYRKKFGKNLELEREKLKDILTSLGIEDKEDKFPFELSGGQKQRVAIGRALILEPKLLCFDEPTSALDPVSTNKIVNVIKDINLKGTGVLVITHDMEFARKVADRIIFLDKGYMVESDESIEEFMFGN